MIPFLHAVARCYASRYPDLSEICFLFPNKRSGTFFLKYLREECGRHVVLAPEVATISDFVVTLSERVVAGRLDLLFLLFEAYRELRGAEGADALSGEDAGEEFDSFRGWGETVLSDFSEADQYLADPQEVFKNVKDYREISANFLTDEQKAVMAEYFGRTDTGDSTRFWKNFDKEDGELSEVKRRFLHLWRIMWPLYQRLEEKLSERGLTTAGGAYRKAVERLRAEGREALPYKKVVAVGFNALSTSEAMLFSEMKGFEGYPGMDSFADFFWDMTGPVLTGGDNSASRFVAGGIRLFPCPEWALPTLRQSDTQTMPRIRVVASPSNSAQVKIAGNLLSELRGRITGEDITSAKVAVVLPDEGLLLPMLYSLPEGMGNVNLTMGYPLRLTSVVPFVTLLRKLQFNRRTVGGESGFYHRDLRLFLAHPFSHSVIGSATVKEIIEYIDRHHKSVVTLSELASHSAAAAKMLTFPPAGSSPQEVTGYMDSVLQDVAESFDEGRGGIVKKRLETDHIRVYRDALSRLSDLLSEYSVKMKASTVFYLADRLLSGETVGFEGEPLTGLQVMGTLETRSIDFDYVMVLSMNERIMPMKARSRTFIPNSLRHAYGMPPANYAESMFSYYFYRMISRATEVTLLYDARTSGGLSSGDVSRYIIQLRHLFAKGKVEEQDWKFLLSGKTPYDPSVEKNEEIRRSLEAYCLDGEGRKNFSASSLNDYRECQVRFFYSQVMGISTDSAPSEYIDAIGVGNILHALMEELYLPDPSARGRYLSEPVEISAARIDAILADAEGLQRHITRVVNRLHFRRDEGAELDIPLTGAAEIIAERILDQVRKVLLHDRTLTPFRIHGCEIKEMLKITLGNGRKVNFKFAIDRLDEINIEGKRQLRIVDYKTGRIKLEAADMAEVMDGGYESEQIFQLFTYAWLLWKREGGEKAPDVRTEIYDVTKIFLNEECLPVIGGERAESFPLFAEEFSSAMDKMLQGVFDSPAFRAPEGDERCGLCAFRPLCKR